MVTAFLRWYLTHRFTIELILLPLAVLSTIRHADQGDMIGAAVYFVIMLWFMFDLYCIHTKHDVYDELESSLR